MRYTEKKTHISTAELMDRLTGATPLPTESRLAAYDELLSSRHRLTAEQRAEIRDCEPYLCEAIQEKGHVDNRGVRYTAKCGAITRSLPT